MAWFGESLANFTGQVSNLAKEVLLESRDDGPETREVGELDEANNAIRELQSICDSQKQEIERLRLESAETLEKVELEDRHLRSRVGEFEDLLTSKEEENRILKKKIEDLHSAEQLRLLKLQEKTVETTSKTTTAEEDKEQTEAKVTTTGTNTEEKDGEAKAFADVAVGDASIGIDDGTHQVERDSELLDEKMELEERCNSYQNDLFLLREELMLLQHNLDEKEISGRRLTQELESLLENEFVLDGQRVVKIPKVQHHHHHHHDSSRYQDVAEEEVILSAVRQLASIWKDLVDRKGTLERRVAKLSSRGGGGLREEEEEKLREEDEEGQVEEEEGSSSGAATILANTFLPPKVDSFVLETILEDERGEEGHAVDYETDDPLSRDFSKESSLEVQLVGMRQRVDGGVQTDGAVVDEDEVVRRVEEAREEERRRGEVRLVEKAEEVEKVRKELRSREEEVEGVRKECREREEEVEKVKMELREHEEEWRTQEARLLEASEEARRESAEQLRREEEKLAEEVEQVKRSYEEREEELRKQLQEGPPRNDEELNLRVTEALEEERRHAEQRFQEQVTAIKVEAEKREDELRRLVSEADAKVIRLEGELGRLRNHLVELEEQATNDAVISEQRERELQAQLVQLRTQIAQSLHDNDRIEGIREEVTRVGAERDEAKSRIGGYEEQLQKQGMQLQNLHFVLEQFQKEKETEVANLDKMLRADISKLMGEKESLYKEIKAREEALETARGGLEAAAHLGAQIEEKTRTINALRMEVQEKDKEVSKLEAKLNEIGASLDGKIDRYLVKNLIVGYFSTPQDKRKEVLRVLATVLDFNREDRQKTGLEGTSLWPFGRGGGGEAGGDKPSLSESFIKFLESESQPKVQVRMTAEEQSIGNSRARSASGASETPPGTSTTTTAPSGGGASPAPNTVPSPAATTAASEISMSMPVFSQSDRSNSILKDVLNPGHNI